MGETLDIFSPSSPRNTMFMVEYVYSLPTSIERLKSSLQTIKAIDRAGLNKRLLDELEELPNAKLFFNYKLTGANFDKGLAWFETKNNAMTESRNPEIEVKYNLLLGADGAHSATRHHLMKYTRMDFRQEYIDTLWCEFQIPPTGDGEFRISPNHLHIWPAGDSMFIAIPDSVSNFEYSNEL